MVRSRVMLSSLIPDDTVIIIGGVLLIILLLMWLFVRKRREKELKTERLNAQKESSGIKTCEPNKDKLTISEKHRYRVGKLHNVGKREKQQDAFAVSDVEDQDLCETKGVMAIVADGMGGLTDGDKISSMVTLSLFRHFHEREHSANLGNTLLEMLGEANSEVNSFLGDRLKMCGSTLVAGIVKGNLFHWISVGDSHIYLYRNGNLLQLNKEHVYAVELDVKAANGEISREEALRDKQRGALTSYLGMGRLEQVDRSLKPLELQHGDRLLLMTDGVFGTLNDEQIVMAMRRPVEDSAKWMEEEIQKADKPNQDNYTAVILEYC